MSMISDLDTRIVLRHSGVRANHRNLTQLIEIFRPTVQRLLDQGLSISEVAALLKQVVAEVKADVCEHQSRQE